MCDILSMPTVPDMSAPTSPGSPLMGMDNLFSYLMENETKPSMTQEALHLGNDSNPLVLPEIDLLSSLESDPVPPLPVLSNTIPAIDTTKGNKGKKAPRKESEPGRNARMAKLNRERKKQYVQGLETEIAALKEGLVESDKAKQSLEHELSQAQQEIEYLRSVVANQSAIASLLATVSNSGLSLDASASMPGTVSRKRNASDEHSPIETNTNTRKSRRVSNKKSATTVIPIQFNLHVPAPSA